MTNHTVWGHASDALYTLHTKNAAEMEYTPDEPIHSQFVPSLFNAAGVGMPSAGPAANCSPTCDTAIEHMSANRPPRPARPGAAPAAHAAPAARHHTRGQ